MVNLTATPATDTKWPFREASAYADWWRLAEAKAGARDIVDSMVLLAFAPKVERDGESTFVRFRLTTTPERIDGVLRELPIWKQAAPPTPNSELDDGTVMIDPGKDFFDPLAPETTVPPAVMVIIDTAINPLHEQFRGAADQPRILAHWLMEGVYRDDTRVPFGREIRNAEIAPFALAPEDDALQALHVYTMKNPFAPRGGAQIAAHGTHVLGLAAGCDPQSQTDTAAALRNVPILAVSLPSNRLLSASGVFLDVFVDQALEWVSVRLRELFGEQYPDVVLNLSYGLAAGPKDRTGYLNSRIRGWRRQNPQVQMFLPAGNDGLIRGHAVLIPDEGKAEIGWLVPPGDRFSTHAEVWFDGGPDVTMSITPPDGTALLFARKSTAVTDLTDATGLLTGRVYNLREQHGTDRPGFLICLAPTRPLRTGAKQAPAGIWRIAVQGQPGVTAQVHLQSERNLEPGSHNSSPSRLVKVSDAGAEPQRPGTLNALGFSTGVTI
ncbi:MAG: hypothetical protein ACRC14_15590, partial [Paracoccaceae bacterium]